MAASLRSFADGDRGAVLALSRHALARLEEQVGTPLWATREELDRELAAWGDDPAATLRVADDDGVVAAFGGVQLGGDPTIVGPLVAPRFRGRKLGSVLLEASVELAREREAAWLLASVGPRNVAGRLLLERYGFRPQEGLNAVYRLVSADHRPSGPAPPGIELRPGVLADLARVWALYRQGSPGGRRPEEVWRAWLETGEVVVAQRGVEAVAYVHLEPAAHRVSHVGVAEEERGLGVGGYLFSRAVEDFWRTRPGEALRLTVMPYDTPSIRLYRRLGFAPWLVLQGFERRL